MGHCQSPFNGETETFKPVTDGFWMKVIIQCCEFNRLQRKWIPCLLSEQITQYCLEISLVREFENECAFGMKDVRHLAQCFRRVRHMMQGSDHRRHIKQTIHKRQTVRICSNIDVSVRLTESRLRLF